MAKSLLHVSLNAHGLVQKCVVKKTMLSLAPCFWYQSIAMLHAFGKNEEWLKLFFLNTWVWKIFLNILDILCWVFISDWMMHQLKTSYENLVHVYLLDTLVPWSSSVVHLFTLLALFLPFLLYFLFLLFPFTFLLFPLFSDLAPQTAWAYIQGCIFFDSYRLFKFVYCLLG